MKEFYDSRKVLIRRLVLIVFDSFAIGTASLLALLLRFDFSYEKIFPEFLETAYSYMPINIITTILVFYILKLYHSLWRFMGVTEFQNITAACFVSSVIQFIGIHALNFRICRSYYILYGIFLFVFICGSRFTYRLLRTIRSKIDMKKQGMNTMIIGAGEAGNMIIKEIVSSKYVNINAKCVVDDDTNKIGSYIHGIKVVGNRECILEYVNKLRIKQIIIAMPSIPKNITKDIVNICKETDCELKILPGIYQFMNGEVKISKLRKVEIEDLLGRDPVQVDIDSVAGYVKEKVILITGGGGSIGSELCRQIALHNPKQLIIVDIYENNVYDIQLELKRKYPKLNLVVLIASVRNVKRIDKIFREYCPQIVYHAAAHKHVPLMEDSPNEAIKNNVFGTFNTVQAADRNGVEKFVLISTDKAVNPTNIMGASKRICEMIVQTYNKKSKTDFVAVRFGNVLGSNGSVIPLFKKQIEQGGPVTITHPDIIRYFMTIPEAVALVLQAGAFAKGGEIFILDMGEPVKILDLAKNLIRLSGFVPNEDIMIEFTGLRPGEKLYEELLMAEEGMQDTANKLIHIGKPIQMNENDFLEQLNELKGIIDDEPDDIKSIIQKIVPTYIFSK